MKHTRRTLTEALTDLSIVNEFMNALPSVGDSVPVDKFIEKSTPLLTAMQYLKSYKQLYSLYQTAVKTPQLQSLILSLFFIITFYYWNPEFNYFSLLIYFNGE